MRLDQSLFREPYLAYVVKTHEDSSDFLEWELEPLMGPTLSAAYVPDRRLEGEFLVISKVVATAGATERCYLSVVLPERVPEYHFRLQGSRIVGARGRQTNSGTVIPSIAIEAVGTYTLYLVKHKIEEGIEVLRSGLAQAREKGPVALDLAYLLRDAGRSEEAIEAFTMAITLVSVDRFTRALYYRERAALHQRLGNETEAASDRVQADTLQGKSPQAK